MSGWQRRWVVVVLLSALCGFLFFYGLNAGDLYRTEGLRAAVASSCLRGESWVVPTLFGEPLFTKPPGQYVAIALCSAPFGVISETTARLPSALAATATVFLFYWFFARQLGRRGGLIAAVILPLSVVWFDKAPSAEIDMLQLFWVAASVLFFMRALENDEESRPSWSWWLASLVCVAGGVLTKWTAPVFFYGTVLPLLWWRGRLRLLLRPGHLIGLAVAVGVCAGWMALAVAETGWDALWSTVSREAVQRLSPGHHLEAAQSMPHHGEGLPLWAESLLHPLRVFGSLLPWSPFALVALWPGFGRLWDERGRRVLQLLHCWVWPSLLFWSLIPEHALRHSIPLFPALSGLAAMVWLRWLREIRNPKLEIRNESQGPNKKTQNQFETLLIRIWNSFRISSFGFRVFVALVLVTLLAKVVFVEAIIPRRNPNRAPRAKGEQLDTLVPRHRPLYVARLKDEGILFYFGRTRPLGESGPPVQKVNDLEGLLSKPEPVYCILDAFEWQRWQKEGKADLVADLVDEQRAPIFLVRTRPATGGEEESGR